MHRVRTRRSFLTDSAPFGALTSCPTGPQLPAPTGTGGWDAGGDLLLRTTFTVPAGTGAGSVSPRIDNDVSVYLNGARRRRQPDGGVVVVLKLPARAEDPRMR